MAHSCQKLSSSILTIESNQIKCIISGKGDTSNNEVSLELAAEESPGCLLIAEEMLGALLLPSSPHTLPLARAT